MGYESVTFSCSCLFWGSPARDLRHSAETRQVSGSIRTKDAIELHLNR